MTLPAGGVLARSEILGLRRVQDALDSPPEPLSSLRNPSPQVLKHPENIVGGDLVDGLGPKADGIFGKGHLPLIGVLLVAPARSHGLDIFVREISKVRGLLLQEHSTRIATVC